jgi:L-ascorbate metabolism protein UlaG (beta-lactamase superfamily)
LPALIPFIALLLAFKLPAYSTFILDKNQKEFKLYSKISEREEKMQKFFSICGLLLILVSGNLYSEILADVLSKIVWLGQAGVRIMDKKVIYIDPFALKGNHPKADIILITHDHPDHLDKKSIELIAKKNTMVVFPESIKVDVNGVILKPVKVNSTNIIEGYKIVAVPAYNIKKTMFHPKNKGYVGYIVEIDGIKIYHTGDTERIPEMKNINADIILLPLGQTYTMNSVEEAVEVVKDVKAKVAIPIHFGLYEGKAIDATNFCKLLEKEKIKCNILEIWR